MSVLDDICARKREHIEAQKQKITLDDLKKKINSAAEPIGFIKALKKHPAPSIIAEVKKASPSMGVIREDFDPVEIAKIYEQSGAACISVLTDEPFFQGHDDYLRDIRNAVKIPLLRKDFMLDEYQVFESRALGADCILLIMAVLTDDKAKKLNTFAGILGMDVLIEVHDESELTRALRLKPGMIGINNRNLKTLAVDMQTSFSLGKKIPDGIVKIVESGISQASTIKELQAAGFNAFLIGESLMREKNIGAAFTALLKKD